MKWVWIVLAIFLGIGELLTVEFFLLWFAIGALIAAFVANFSSFTYQLLVFVIVSIVLMIFSRRLILGRNGAKTNIEALVGKEGIVIETVQRVYCDRGLVRVNGEVWRAYSEDEYIVPGTAIRVIEVNGTKLKVEAINQQL